MHSLSHCASKPGCSKTVLLIREAANHMKRNAGILQDRVHSGWAYDVFARGTTEKPSEAEP